VELFKDFGIWKIAAHIAFKFYSGACETFSTGSTLELTRRRSAAREPKSAAFWRSR
jgi:hypothetical protein